MAQSFKELGKKAESLSEQGREAGQQVVNCQNRVNALQARVASAHRQLAAASETDEEGHPVGDVAGAQAALYVAQGQLVAGQRALEAAEAEARRVRSAQSSHVRTIEQHNRIERENLKKLDALRHHAFSGDADALLAGIAERINKTEEARARLLQSMGLEASPDYVSAEGLPGNGLGWGPGRFGPLDLSGTPQHFQGGLGEGIGDAGLSAPVGGALAGVTGQAIGADTQMAPMTDGPARTDDAMVLRKKPQQILAEGNQYIDRILEVYRDDLRDKGVPDGRVLEEQMEAFRRLYQNILSNDVQNGTFLLYEYSSPDFAALAQELKGKDLQDTEQRLYTSFGAETVQIGGFDPRVAHDMANALEDAKRDFPGLKIAYFGSCQEQAASIRAELTAYYTDAFSPLKQHNGWTDEQFDQFVRTNVEQFISKAGLDDTRGTFAWSYSTQHGNGRLAKYSGIAVNLDYAADYKKFRKAKIENVRSRYKPIGCDSPRATMDHELGHEIDRLLGASRDPQINAWYNEMLRDGSAEKALSGYAKSSIFEFIAEGYSEYRNNPHPRAYAKKIYDRLIELNQLQTKEGLTNG